MDSVPDKGPLLFVGNHTIYGVMDIPMLFRELLLKRNIFLRTLGDHAHFKIPVWRTFMTKYGVVDGTRENCAALMENGESILVFPGGGREVSKRKDEKYKLVWGKRIGFARMAIQHGCTIVPFSAVGVEDAFDIIWDADDILATPLGKLMIKLGMRADLVPPISKGLGPTPIPRPHRLYFRLGTPIETKDYGGDFENEDKLHDLRDRTRADIELGIEWLLEKRKRDPKKNLLPRVISELRKLADQRGS
jgi:1-acyl-sn-glycerol-3-phosphate acyltransferase